MKIDLHCHSNASDGSLTPEEIVLRAHNLQVQVLALTDHDTLTGIASARAQAAALKGGVNLQVLSGIELSCRWEGYEIHILGWCFDPASPAMQAVVAEQASARRQRAEMMLNKLQQNGVAASDLSAVWERQASKAHLVTRKHLADALLAGGYVRTLDEAFKRYLGKGNCAYISPEWCSIERAAEALRQAGGSSSLAHPLAYNLSTKWLKRLLQACSDAGIDALEVSSGQQSPQQRNQLAQLATDYKLKSSVGSDFHSPGRWRELGRNLHLPEQCEPVWQDWPLTL